MFSLRSIVSYLWSNGSECAYTKMLGKQIQHGCPLQDHHSFLVLRDNFPDLLGNVPHFTAHIIAIENWVSVGKEVGLFFLRLVRFVVQRHGWHLRNQIQIVFLDFGVFAPIISKSVASNIVWIKAGLEQACLRRRKTTNIICFVTFFWGCSGRL